MTTRRKLLSSLAAAAIYPCWIEPRWLDLTRRRVRLSRSTLSHTVRILHLSDLHASFFVPLSMVEEAIRQGLSANPDLICLTGDFISNRDDPPAPADYVRVLRRLSAASPTFAVAGNHDGGSWAAARRGHADHRLVDRILAESGIELLHNRSQTVEVHGQRLTLVGIGDYWSGEADPDRALRAVDPPWPVLLLAHNPDSKEICAPYPWDLMLSGHTHGGQVVLPLYGAPYSTVEDTRYLQGLKPWGARQIHVTRGVGNLLGVRFNCRPEVSLLEVV
jgi:predicted MPP superfamily phosphohydrolase